MNGRENSTSLALFFALVSIGAIIKGDEFIGIGVGAVFAIIAAFFLKQSILQEAVTEEDTDGKMEITQNSFKIWTKKHSRNGMINYTRCLLYIFML